MSSALERNLPERTRSARATWGLIPGDITQMPADVVLLPAISRGPRVSQVDTAMQRRFGHSYYDVLDQQEGHLLEGDIVYIPNEKVRLQEKPPFEAIAFVIDDLTESVDTVIEKALNALNKLPEPSASVTMPLMRTGIQSRVREEPEAAVAHLGAGIKRFVDNTPFPKVQLIQVVVYPRSLSQQQLGQLQRGF